MNTTKLKFNHTKLLRRTCQSINKRIMECTHRVRCIIHNLGWWLILICLFPHIVLITVTPMKVLICYATGPHKIMQGHTCNYDSGLLMRCIRRDLLQDPPLHFQNSK